MQITQRGRASRRGQVLGGVRLRTRGVHLSWGMRGYGHLKGGWKLQGKKVGSAQYI